jgi:glycosyltransferase involved in cell wall biosynthesis
MAKSKQSKVQDIFVSTVVAIDSNSGNAVEYIRELSGVLLASYTNYEIVIALNTQDDDLLSDLKVITTELPCIRLLAFSRTQNIDTAIYAGLESVIGDYTVVLVEGIDPVTMVPSIVEANKETDIVQGVSKVTPAGIGVGRRVFYWYSRRYMGIDIPLSATYCMGLSRRALNVLTTSSRDHRHIRQLIRVIGFKLQNVSYVPLGALNRPWTLQTGVLEAFDIATSYSTHPLRLVSWVGVGASLLNLIYAIYVVAINLSGSEVAQGWTTTSLQLSGMFFVLFLAVVVISEYIGRTLIEQRHEQRYIISDEYTSTVSIADVNRKNITK